MLRVLFAGSPDCAVPALEAVAGSHCVVGILTNPPSAKGRSGKPEPTAVAEAAERLREKGLIGPEVPLFTPEKITDEVRLAIAAVKPDVMACFAYGKIFGPKTLALFPLGALNLHPSLLPRWRGSTPVPACILARDEETGITVQRMALAMDEGDIIVQTRFPLTGRETAGELLERSGREGAPLMVEALNLLERGEAAGTPQRGEATYCGMLSKEDGEIDWNAPAKEIDAKIRAVTPWPGAYTHSGDAVLIIHRAEPVPGPEGTAPEEGLSGPAGEAPKPGTVLGMDKKRGILVQTGEGLLALETLQWRTKKILDWKSFINGTRDFPGTVLTKRNTP